MKRSDKSINEEIEKTLSAFDKTDRATPKPFFFTRIQGKLEGELDIAGSRLVLPQLIYRAAIVFVIVLVALNIYSGIQFLGTTEDNALTTVDEGSWVEEFYPQSSSTITLEDE